MEYLDTEDIIRLCSENLQSFTDAIENISYEAKGIFNSEMLLFCSLSTHLGVKNIIESGRARAQSTKILANFFASENAYSIESIEYNKYTEDAVIAMRRMAGVDNLVLHFGDAFDLLPALIIGDPCTVLIDGPKSGAAILLASQVLRNPNTKAVFIHDTHRDGDHRELIEELYPHALFTDNETYVQRFRYLDDVCWNQQRQYPGFQNWGPYRRGDRKMSSYSGTLAMILNDPAGLDKVNQCREYIEQTPNLYSWNREIRRLLWRFRKAGKIPYWFIRYYLARATLSKGV